MIKPLRTPRLAGEVGRALAAVVDWAENARIEAGQRFAVRRAATSVVSWDMVISGGSRTSLPAASEDNRGTMVMVCVPTAPTTSTISTVTYGTTSVSVTGAVLFASDGSRWWPVTGTAT